MALLYASAWLSWAAAFGDRTTAMVVALAATAALYALATGRLALGSRRFVVAAALGATPVIAFATLRALSEPLMGTAFGDGAARAREGTEAVVIAVVLAGAFALLAGWVARRSSERLRVGRWLLGVLTWSPVLIVPLVLVHTLSDGLSTPSPDRYGLSQPILGHMAPAPTGEQVVIDELAREEGITLVRVCEQTPWCYTLLRRGDRVTTRPGVVSRDAAVHLRFDPVHALYLVESDGALVATIDADNLASYTRLLPHHVRGSVGPPRAFQLLAGLGLGWVVWLVAVRRRLRSRRSQATDGEVGVCFGDGWGLLADGTTMRVPPDMKPGSILVSWAKGRDRTLTILEGTREELGRALDERRRALDATQLAVLWTLCTPLVMSAALV